MGRRFRAHCERTGKTGLDVVGPQPNNRRIFSGVLGDALDGTLLGEVAMGFPDLTPLANDPFSMLQFLLFVLLLIPLTLFYRIFCAFTAG